jgi:putative membrane protein
VTSFTDGEWHRLHPATPLLRGGIALIAIISFMVYNLRDQLIEGFLGGRDEDDPLAWLTDNGFFWPVAFGVLVVLVLFVGGFYLSWRMHTFRITAEVVEIRSGILFRTNRKARLDRIQGINIVRPFIARLVGAAKLEINVAGQDANVQLSYLGSASADELRAEVLRLASGTQHRATARPPLGSGDVIRDRVAELLAPELDPQLAPPHSVVAMNLGRVLGSLLLSNFTIVLIVVIASFAVGAGVFRQPAILIPILPGLFGMASYYSNRFSRSLRFTIAGTPDGIRIGYGLLSTTNETLPPGRIHSVQVSQPLLWRIPDWWEIKVNRASKSSTNGAANQANTTILPVGNRTDVMRVLALVLPTLDSPEAAALLTAGLASRGAADGFVNSPRRAVVLRWFSWRRNGLSIADDAVLLRTGAIWRQLVIVPLARLQSVALEIGWLRRRLRLATLRLHTVAGPITPVIGAVDDAVARAFFNRVAAAAVLHGGNDTSQRWRAND